MNSVVWGGFGMVVIVRILHGTDLMRLMPERVLRRGEQGRARLRRSSSERQSDLGKEEPPSGNFLF